MLAAVGLAFAQHRDLVLSPDAIWLTIAQGVAQHVRLHAEALRPRLVRHEGRKKLILPWDGAMPTDPASWSAAVAAFRRLLADEIGDGRARLFECDFSTSTEVDRTASQVVLLDAYSPYFSCWMFCVCGIPSITLTGTVEDWRRVRQRIDVIAELDLELWCRSLVPILDHFVRAAAGDVDVAFWRRIYNPVDAYGGAVITGWVTRLYPYLTDGETTSHRNPMLELPIDEPRNLTPSRGAWYSGPGIRSEAVKDVASRVTVHVVDRVTQQQRAVALVAGLVGVTQRDDGALCPIAGWHLEAATADLADVVDRIVREHHAVAAEAGAERPRFVEGSAEVLALFDRLATAILFDGDRAWRFRPITEHDYVSIDGAGTFSIRRIIDVPGGKSLCCADDHRTGAVHWLLCRIDEPEVSRGEPHADAIVVRPAHVTVCDEPAQIPVLGSSLAALLDAALDAGGEIDHLEVARFHQVLQQQRERRPAR